MTYAFRDGSLGAYYPAQPPEDNGVGALGHPLYVNGHLFQEPVTIAHVPGTAGFGQDAPAPVQTDSAQRLLIKTVYPVLSLAGLVTGIYHGYKRNNSAGWALAWGLFGSVMPFISVPLSIAQGYGEKK